jgi:hypothetical protein
VGRGFGLLKVLYTMNKFYGMARINGWDKNVLSIWSIFHPNIGKGKDEITSKGWVKDIDSKVQ